MDVVEVKISDLKSAAYNPRKLSKDQEESLKQSLTRFGFIDPVIVNKNPKRKNIIVGGHQRVKVWAMLGNKTVPVCFVDLDEDKERECNIRLNKATGDWDWSLLQEFFDKDELMQWGFTEDDLYGRFKDKTTGDDDAPGLPTKATTKLGDLYQLGPHRLLCGDSTSPDHMARLMEGGPADLVFTDPPYNVNYSGIGKKTSRKIENDHMDEKSFREFLVPAFQRMADNSKPGAALYCCYASRTHREFEDSINAAGYEVRNQIIWVKTVASMGWGDYRWKHEPMLYCRKPGAKLEFYADRTQTTAWDEMPKDEELLAMVKAMIKREEDGHSTVWRFSRESQYVHPCLPAGEMVLANESWRPIDSIAVGDKTSYGTVTEISNHDAEAVVEITLEDGSTIRATENHPFLIESDGDIYWIEARMIKKGDLALTNEDAHNTMKPCEKDTSPQRDILEFTTPEKSAGDLSTSLSGKGTTESMCQQVIKSTTRTETSSTILLRTSNLLRPLSRSGITQVASMTELEDGLSPVKIADRASRSHRSIGTTPEDGQQVEFAENAVLSEASKFVKLSRRAVGSVRIIPGKIRVYNLTIEGVPAFDTIIGISHNTQKPVALVTKALVNSCKTHGIVLDPFGGSGSTLIAAEKNDRQARTMEMDPAFCDVIVKRYVEYCQKNERPWSVTKNGKPYLTEVEA